MKITLLIGFLLFNHVTCMNAPSVYICDSSGAKRYHLNSKCKGLSNCQHKIISTTLELAKRKGRTLCKLEEQESVTTK